MACPNKGDISQCLICEVVLYSKLNRAVTGIMSMNQPPVSVIFVIRQIMNALKTNIYIVLDACKEAGL
jgi:hypothetical protein